MAEHSKESFYNERKIEEATDSIINILNDFSKEETNIIMTKIKILHLEDRVATLLVERLLKTSLK